MNCRCLSVVVFLVLTAPASPANAQSEGRFAIGGEVGVNGASDPDVHASKDIRLLWRFGHSKTGWGWHWGLNWYATDVDRTIGGGDVALGELNIRPVMVGYGYTHVFGRTAVTASALGGLALTSLSLTPVANDAYRDRLGARLVSSDSAMTPVARPGVSVWYDINKKFGLHVGAGYMIARPRVTVKSTLGDDKRGVRADMVSVKVGLAYSVF